MQSVQYAMVLAVVSWLVFASMNELTSAHEEETGCCGNENCGKNWTTNMTWWLNLMVACAATFVVLYSGARMTPFGRRLLPPLYPSKSKIIGA